MALYGHVKILESVRAGKGWNWRPGIEMKRVSQDLSSR